MYNYSVPSAEVVSEMIKQKQKDKTQEASFLIDSVSEANKRIRWERSLSREPAQ